MRFRRAFAALALVAAGSAASAAEQGVAGVVAGFQGWLDGTRTLEARFRQSLISGALGASAIESGRMYLERPGKLRWDYLVPERKVALLIGDRTDLYLEEDRQLIRGRLEAEQSLFPRLLAGRDRVQELFVPTLTPTPAGGRERLYRLKLTPRERGGALSEVSLDLKAGTFEIVGAEVLDEMGNRTRYAFTGLRRNAALPVGLFAFEPPAGTEVVEAP